MTKFYAGIGSRETPKHVQEYFYNLAAFLASRGYILRSGGADKAFELGCDKVHGQKEIYLPWAKFEGSTSNLIVSNPKAYDIAKSLHPYWDNLSMGAKKLQSRNSHQVLGFDLETPSQFAICWTKGGKGLGGTGQALRIARHYGIPVFDAGAYETVDEVKKELKQFLIVNGVFNEEDLTK